MLYDLRHVTICSYGATVTYSRCNLRCLPKDGPGQRVIESRLEIAPEAVKSNERRCFFGNRVVYARIETPHRELRAEARGRIEVDRPRPPQSTPAWEVVREDAFAADSLDPQSPTHFLYPSRFVPLFEPAIEYARESFAPGRPVLEAASELMARIRRDFRYDTKATDVRTPLSVAFEKRRGVCQDFTHIMIAGLRGHGLPAAYVSGYIRTIPPKENRASKAPTRRMRGCRSGAAARRVSSISIRPTISSLPTITSFSRMAAIIPTFRRSTASCSAPASRKSMSASM